VSEFSESIPIEGIRRVEVRIPRGDIDVRRVSGDAIEVQSDGAITFVRDEDSVQIRPGGSGQRLRSRIKPPVPFPGEGSSFGAAIGEMVSGAVESILAVDFNFSGFGSCDMKVGIPASLELPELFFSTGMGEIKVEDLSANCSLVTSKGEIEATNCSGSLRASTGMGDVTIDHFAGPVTAHTGAGDADLKDCDGGGVMQTGSGDIKADEIAGAWSVRSGAGDVDIRVAGEASLEVVSGAGDISVDRGSLHRLTVHSGSGDVECKSLLAGPRHQIVTGHGDITVAIADPPGARLQILTRNGEVKSEYPLVGVGKQGRYAGSGGRYVGSIGDSVIDLELRTTSGDISIKRRAPGEGARRDYESYARPLAPETPLEFGPAGFSAPPAPPGFSVPLEPPARGAELDRPISPSMPDTHAPGRAWDSGRDAPVSRGNPRLAILENLQAGKISVNEATALLDSLARQDAGPR
jgi:DUF4097 and DUF4098 domain-containing protein YvlB